MEDNIFDEDYTFDKLDERGYSTDVINQVLKAKNDGLYIHLMTPHLMDITKLRNYRQYMMNKGDFKAFTRKQLYHLQMGYLTDIDISVYYDPHYSSTDMLFLRKSIQKNYDVDFIKEYHKQWDVKHSIEAIYLLFKAGLVKDEIEFFSPSALSTLKTLADENIDALKIYIGKGFDINQITTLFSCHHVYDKLYKYIDSDYDESTFLVYAALLKDFEYNKIDFLFNTAYSKKILTEALRLLKNNIEIDDIISPDFIEEKNRALICAMDNYVDIKCVERIKNSELSCDRYITILCAIEEGFNITDMYFNQNISDYFIHKYREKLDCNYIKKIQDNIADKGIRHILITTYHEDNFDYLDVVKDADNSFIANLRIKAFDLIKHDFDKIEKIKTLTREYQLENLKACIYNDIDYSNIDLNMSYQTFDLIVAAKKKGIDISNIIDGYFDFAQIALIIKAIENDIDTSNLCIKDLKRDTYQMIYTVEKFNKENERQIDINDIIKLDDFSIKICGPIISDLLSDDLEKNLSAYKKIKDLINDHKYIDNEKEI